jgi:tRNA A37 threonylcarbamoyladenosine synthetase subunit TsaC/SUA5/YrdC
VRDFDDLDRYIVISSEQKEYLKNYPHPWSILGTRRGDFVLPDFLDANQYSKISLRVAERCIFPDIRDQIDYPIFLTSANLSGQRESTTLEMAQDAFPGVS